MSKLTLSDKVGFLSIGRGLGSFLVFVSGMLLVRLLSLSEYGTYRQVWLIYTMVVPFFSMGISSSFYRFFPILSEEERKVFVTNSITVLTFLGLMLTLILYHFADFFGMKFSNPETGRLLKIFAFYPLFFLPGSFIHSLLIARDKIFSAVVINIIDSLLVSLIVVMPLFLGFDLTFVFKLYVVLTLIGTIFKIGYMSKIVNGFSLKQSRGLLIKQLKFSIPLGFAYSMGTLAKFIDKFMISLNFLVEKFAVFSRGAFELPFIAILTSSVVSITMPNFAKLHKEKKIRDLIRLWHESIRKTALIICATAVFLFVFAKQFIILLYSDSYSASSRLFQIYLFLVLLRVCNYGSVLTALGYSKVILAGSIYVLISNIIFNILFIKLFGFIGPAIATVFVIYTLSLFYLYKTKKILNVKFREIFPWFQVGQILLLAIISAGLVCPLTLMTLPRFIILFLGAVLFTAIYLFFLYKFKILHEGDISLVKRWVNFRIFFADRVQK